MSSTNLQKCPICSCNVNGDNLDKHIKRIHGVEKDQMAQKIADEEKRLNQIFATLRATKERKLSQEMNAQKADEEKRLNQEMALIGDSKFKQIQSEQNNIITQENNGYKGLIYGVRLLILLFVLSLWGVLGLVIWIPFIIRMVALYSALVLLSVFHSVDLNNAQLVLNRAITFYVDGFNVSIKALLSIPNTQSYSVSFHNDIKAAFATALWHIFYTIMFWGSVFIVYLFW
jgi:cation transport ATPase